MRKFKLIKKLPFEGSPDIGYISIEKLGENGAHYWNHNWFHPENYPEFWEEMVEKEYEILVYRSKTNSWILIDDPKDFGRLEFSEWEIFSIRRKSDGVEFKIGDKVYWNWQYSSQKYYTIDKFFIREDDNSVGFYTKESCRYYWVFSKIQHYKEPILTTEDGVELYQYDNFYFVDTMFNLGKGVLSANLHNPIREYKHFSTKENAEKYIYNNKPEFSKKQLVDIIEGNEELSDGEVIEEIYKLINK